MLWADTGHPLGLVNHRSKSYGNTLKSLVVLGRIKAICGCKSSAWIIRIRCGYSGEGVYPVNRRCQALDGAMEKTTTSATNHTHKRSRRVRPYDTVEKKHMLSCHVSARVWACALPASEHFLDDAVASCDNPSRPALALRHAKPLPQ